MTPKIWLKQYPAGMPAQLDLSQYSSLVALMDDAFARHAQRDAYVFMGKSFAFREIDRLSQAFAAWLQGQGLQRGDRVAIMLPNTPQYPVVVAAVLRAGFVVVNVNPLYTPRELQHQLHDAGAKALVIMEMFAHAYEQVREQVPVGSVVVCAMGDMLGTLKGGLVNLVVRHLRKMVPAYRLPGSVRFNDVIAQGERLPRKPAQVGPDDIAVLQYTGGTTGVAKGAALLHRNLVANVLQCEAWFQPALRKVPAHEQPTKICALPLYHVFAFTVNLMLGLRIGARNILLPNARDLAGVLKTLSGERVHVFPAVNTLFHGLAHHPDFQTVDWSHLCLSVGGGMAVQQATAKLWLERTGCPICEGYGLSETSPVLTCCPTDATAFTGSIGLPLPDTDIVLLDDDGRPVAQGQAGEICAKGPQVMAGYWQRPDETAKVMTADGFFRTGDIGVMDSLGYVRLIDRKKDMIIVSGFKVFPNEVEDVLTQMPGIAEAATIGVPDDKTGEAVKVVLVRKDPSITEGDVRVYCEQNLTGYKRPRIIEFRDDLPKTPVGKILRRELRTGPAAAAAAAAAR